LEEELFSLAIAARVKRAASLGSTRRRLITSRFRGPDGSSTRKLINGIFSWLLERLAQSGLLKGKTIGVDSTTLEANAAMKSIVRRDTGESYSGYLKRRELHRATRPPTEPRC
jgi:hypothetical protein